MNFMQMNMEDLVSGTSVLYKFSKGAHANTRTKDYVQLYARIDRMFSLTESLKKLNLESWRDSVVNYYLWHEGKAHLVRSSRSKDGKIYKVTPEELFCPIDSIMPYSEEKMGLKWFEAGQQINKILKDDFAYIPI